MESKTFLGKSKDSFNWRGTFLCVLGFLAAITVSALDKMGMRQLGLEGLIQQESKKVRFQDLRYLPLRYWLLVLTIMFFYNGVFPFVADASKFIQDKYSGYSQREAAYIAGAVYDSSLVLSATVGILIDSVGLRGVFAVGCAVLTLPVFALLAFTFVPPLVSTLWLGVTYSFAAATLGTAMGLATSVQMIGIGVCNLIVGQILGTESSDVKIPLERWQQVMFFMLANTIGCIVSSLILNIVDKRQVRRVCPHVTPAFTQVRVPGSLLHLHKCVSLGHSCIYTSACPRVTPAFTQVRVPMSLLHLHKCVSPCHSCFYTSACAFSCEQT
ncbi:Major facilitator superfamily domain-containing protein 1 [Acipenser ruthenus]|uniref:Major facilitator superfamily domain-containing protein 1 n=1 Tax=Acipenser ruthenus TaxID=7906 RepID=A0A444V7P1_ACIRT|nr:Major facilitator superfamily domain-containing protein 1 [Acipenser ruthenus]